MIVSHSVVCVGYPEGRSGLISVEHGRGRSGENTQVVLNRIVHFHSVLKEESEPLDVVCNVVLNSGI